MPFKLLFSSKSIGNVNIKNRIVRSATYEKRASKMGYVTENLINLYTELARGGTGLIITGSIAVDPSGTGSPFQPYLFDDSFIEGQKKLVQAVHDYSDVKIAAQLIHTGRQTVHPKYPPIGPSPVPINDVVPKELHKDEIELFTKKFVDAGRRAYESGYDLVQLHAAHGYFLSNFVSPYTNRRKDEYGNNTEGRTKILVDIFNLLRDQVGKAFPIIVKLQILDFLPNGIDLNEAKKVAQILVRCGYAAIEPSGGSDDSMKLTKTAYPSLIIKSVKDENYFLPAAKELKPVLKDCRFILVGGIKNPVSAEDILQNNYADFISMCRPLLREPNLPNRWKGGDITPAQCKSCNSCYTTMLSPGEVYCVPRKRLEKKENKN